MSTGQSSPSGFWGGVMGTTTGVGLLGDECLDPQLDASSIAWDRRLLTSVVILPSNFGGDLWEDDGGDLTKRQYLLVQFLHWGVKQYQSPSR